MKARDITKSLYWMELRDGNEREASILSMLNVMMIIADLLSCHSSTKPWSFEMNDYETEYCLRRIIGKHCKYQIV